MPCYSPLRPYVGKTKENGKMSLVYRKCESWKGEEQKIPCGHCIGCRLERSRQWAVRCMHEASLYKDNCFVTLTYNDENIPEGGSLVNDEWTKFMKRLRKEYGEGIRYYHCGEYGEELLRPHYHALLFNHDFEDKELWSMKNGNKIFISKKLDSLWKKGFSTIGEVNEKTASYVTRYIMKKQYGKNVKEFYGDKLPEYARMSRRPGIGTKWYEKYSREVYPRDEVIFNEKACKPPKFYDEKLKKENLELYEKIKMKRVDNRENVRIEYDRLGRIVVDDNDSFRLKVKEEVKSAQVKMLIRPLEEI